MLCARPHPIRPFLLLLLLTLRLTPSLLHLFHQGDDDLEEEGMSWDELEKQAKRDDTNKRDWDGGGDPSAAPKRRRR